MISTLYTSILALIYLFLTILVIKTRVINKVAIGDDNIPILKQRIRSHANFIEYTPIFLILLFALEFNGASNTIISFIAIMFILGRISHLYSMSFKEKYADGEIKNTIKFRQLGMVLTLLTVTVLAVSNIAICIISFLRSA